MTTVMYGVPFDMSPCAYAIPIPPVDSFQGTFPVAVPTPCPTAVPVVDGASWKEATEERDAAVRQIRLLRDLVHAIEQADACKKQLREAQERVRILRDELKALGVLT